MNRPVSTDAELVIDAHAILGEGPLWDASSGTLVWVDIEAPAVHRYSPSTGETSTLPLERPVGAVAIRERGGLVLAVQGGFWLLEPDLSTLHQFAPVEANVAENRMNDGRCDTVGRFWAGTMGVDARPHAGSLYRLEPDGRVERVLSGVTISNGIDWSPDGRTMYYVDTPTKRVDAFDFDPTTGTISGRRVFVDLADAAGSPDGLTVDSEGFVWVAMWGGWVVRRYSPDGRLDAAPALPVAQVTSCAFGGPRLDDLYVTSASIGLSAEDLREQPHAGGVFRLRPGVRGRRPNEFRG